MHIGKQCDKADRLICPNLAQKILNSGFQVMMKQAAKDRTP